MNLFQHQIDFLKQNFDKSALVWSCGTGKTRTACEWSKSQRTVLIICPKPLKANWIRECIKWGLSDLTTLVLTKEEFRKGWEVYSGYDQVIVDEVHNGFLTPRFKSKMSKALRSYLKKHDVKRVLLLSSTVYSSSPWNIFSLAYYLGYRWDQKKFEYTFFNYVRMGPRMIPVVKKGSEEKLAKIVKKISSVVDINDVMDVPLQNHLDPEYFSLTKEQKKSVVDNYDPLPIVRFTAQHEIENGILIGNEFKSSERYEIDKNERILDLVKENTKVAIVARYNYQIDVLYDLLKEFKPYIIRGDVKDRDKVCQEAEKSDRAVVLIQADCNSGYQLPSFGLCIFASMSYSFVAWQQMQGRFLRMDKPSRTTFVYLLTEGDSIDQAIFDSVSRKMDFNIALYAKNIQNSRKAS